MGIWINLSCFSSKTFIGKIMRLPLKLVPKSAVVPVLQGPLRGKKVVAGSGVHGYWLGTYEISTSKALLRHVSAGDIVFDIGAHAGYFSLLFSRLVGKAGKVFAFEPLPGNIQFLKKHLDLNKCMNVELIEAAVSEKSGRSRFMIGQDSFSGHLVKSGEQGEGHFINIIALNDFVRQRSLDRVDFIKIDVEGAELDVLVGARPILKHMQPTLFISLHSEELSRGVTEFLKSLGYTLISVNANKNDINEQDIKAIYNK